MRGIDAILAEHPFLGGFSKEALTVIAGCAANQRYDAGAYICREGEPADRFFLIRHGTVTLETNLPGRGPMAFQTLGEGEILGVSWLVPPYRWDFDARAVGLVRAIAFDAACLRDKCEADHDLGYELMKRFVPELVRRMQAARLQGLDLYGQPG
jgi:CRP/FNR family transcriptional regulator, cyclic AMP receptor protein